MKNNKNVIMDISKALSKVNVKNRDVNEDLAEKLANNVIEDWSNELIHSNCIENDSSSNGLKYYIKHAILDGIAKSKKP